MKKTKARTVLSGATKKMQNRIHREKHLRETLTQLYSWRTEDAPLCLSGHCSGISVALTKGRIVELTQGLVAIQSTGATIGILIRRFDSIETGKREGARYVRLEREKNIVLIADRTRLMRDRSLLAPITRDLGEIIRYVPLWGRLSGLVN